MLGWASRAAASASRCSRSSRSRRWSPARTALKATERPSSGSRASQTTPNPPRPISRTSSSRPITAPGASQAAQSSWTEAAGALASSIISLVRAPGGSWPDDGLSGPGTFRPSTSMVIRWNPSESRPALEPGGGFSSSWWRPATRGCDRASTGCDEARNLPWNPGALRAMREGPCTRTSSAPWRSSRPSRAAT